MINQQRNGGKGNLLGTYALEEGSTCSVTLMSEGYDIKTCADAVKLVYRGETLPEAQIVSISPNPADTGAEISFEGYGTTSPGGSIISYRWISDRDGEIGSDPTFLSLLSEGKHQISFLVQDDTGTWSLPASTTVYVGGVEVICDNGEACTASIGTWKAVQRTDAVNNYALQATTNGAYGWSPNLPQSGSYEVYMWWSARRSNCKNCTVAVICGEEVLNTTVINQQQGGGQWNLLGTYDLEAGNTCTIGIVSKKYVTTVADAVKFVLTDNQPNAHILFSH